MFFRHDILTQKITRESYEQFSQRVCEIVKNVDIEVIDKIIASMNKRIDRIIANKGERTKYYFDNQESL